MNKTNIILTLCVIALTIACAVSITSPMRLEKRVAEREKVVKARLIKIRAAAERYRAVHGGYAFDMQTLVRGGYMPDSLQYIPFSGGRHFNFSADVITTQSGRELPVMECGATYADYLSGFDGDEIRKLIDDAENDGRYPGLCFGDTESDTGNKGNWEK